jgi:hypothetical protein
MRARSRYAELAGSAPVDVLYCYDDGAALHSGVADVALMCSSSATEGVELLELGEERPVAAPPASHRLARPMIADNGRAARLTEFSDSLPNERLDAIIDRMARGLLVIVVGDGVTDRLGAAVTAIPVIDYPVTHLVLAWPTDQANTSRDELVGLARSLAERSRRRQFLSQQRHLGRQAHRG